MHAVVSMLESVCRFLFLDSISHTEVFCRTVSRHGETIRRRPLDHVKLLQGIAVLLLMNRHLGVGEDVSLWTLTRAPFTSML